MNKQLRFRTVFWGLIGIAFAIFWILLLSGNILWTSDTPPLQVIRDMDNQMRITPQEEYPFFPDRSSDRPPLPYTVPRYAQVYTPETVDEALEKYPENPLPATEFVLARGKNRFETFCAPCHGFEGKGDGTVVKRGFPAPPDLTREITRSYSDTQIFHIISRGQNVMPSYASKLSETDRWAVVHYVRWLQQRAVQTTESSSTEAGE